MVSNSSLFIFFIQRQRSGDAPLVARTQQRLVELSRCAAVDGFHICRSDSRGSWYREVGGQSSPSATQETDHENKEGRGGGFAAADDRGDAAATLLGAHAGELCPGGGAAGGLVLEEPRRGGRRGAARLLPVSAQPEAAGAGHDHDRAVRDQVFLRAGAQARLDRDGYSPSPGGAQAARRAVARGGLADSGRGARTAPPGLPDADLQLRAAPGRRLPPAGGRRPPRPGRHPCPRGQGEQRPLCAVAAGDPGTAGRVLEEPPQSHVPVPLRGPRRRPRGRRGQARADFDGAAGVPQGDACGGRDQGCPRAHPAPQLCDASAGEPGELAPDPGLAGPPLAQDHCGLYAPDRRRRSCGRRQAQRTDDGAVAWAPWRRFSAVMARPTGRGTPIACPGTS